MIQLRDVCVNYSEVNTLKSISMDFQPGQVTALSGHNGSGKSTLLGVLAGTQRFSGTVTGLDHLVVAYVAQHSAVPRTLPLTVREVVSMGRWREQKYWLPFRRSERRLIDECLEIMDLTDLQMRSIHSLSGGQRQRTLLAQGLVQEAGLVLLDEPAAGLDTKTQSAILNAIDREASRGATVIHATHDPRGLEQAARIVQLESGKVVGEPKHGEPTAVPVLPRHF